MKLKSYNILFRLFSFLVDKTNGASIFVKYKLLLGTLILGVGNASAQSVNKIIKNDTIHTVTIKEETPMITCYKPAVVSPRIEKVPDVEIQRNIKGVTLDSHFESLLGVNISIKGRDKDVFLSDINGLFNLDVKTGDTLVFNYMGYERTEFVVTDEIEDFLKIKMKEAPVLCYDVVIMKGHTRGYVDPIYDKKQIQQNYSIYDVDVLPLSPVGDLFDFKYWLAKKIEESQVPIKGNSVMISFIIDEKGNITGAKIESAISKEHKNEILRILSLSSKWKPARKNGKTVKADLWIDWYF